MARGDLDLPRTRLMNGVAIVDEDEVIDLELRTKVD